MNAPKTREVFIQQNMQNRVFFGECQVCEDITDSVSQHLFLFVADEDLCRPVPSGAIHGLYHCSVYGVPSPSLPQALPRDAALHL